MKSKPKPIPLYNYICPACGWIVETKLTKKNGRWSCKPVEKYECGCDLKMRRLN